MPTIPQTTFPSSQTSPDAAGSPARIAVAALDQAAALWAARTRAVPALAALPAPADFPDPQAFADALEDWRESVAAAAEDVLADRPPALEHWRAWFAAELARLAPRLEQAVLDAAAQRADAALRAELDAAAARALDSSGPDEAEAASRDARDALEQAVRLGVLEDAAAEAAAADLAGRVQAGLAVRQADQDPAGFLRALAAGDFPALASEARERLAEGAGLRLALRQAAADRAKEQAAEDARRVPLDRGRVLLRRAEAGLRAALAEDGPAQAQDDPARMPAASPAPAAAQVTAAALAQGGPVPASATAPMAGAAQVTAASQVLDAARELAALPGFASQARDLRRSLDRLPEARARLAETRFVPPAARFAALDKATGQPLGQASEGEPGALAGHGRGQGREREVSGQAVAQAHDAGSGKGQGAPGAKAAPARPWPGPLAVACREVLEQEAAALAADPAGYVRPEAERRLRAAGLDPAAEPEALRHAVLDLQAACGVERPGVLALAEAATLRQEWRSRDAAGQVEFLAGLAPFAGFRHRVAAEVLGPRGPVLLLAAESPALCPAEKAAVLEAAKAPAPAAQGTQPAASHSASNHLAPDHLGSSALASLAASEPQAAQVLAALAQCLAATSGDPEDAARLLDALAPEALRLWGQAPTLTPHPEHESPYRQDEASPYPPTGDEDSGPAKPKEEEDTLKGGVGEETLAGGAGQETLPGGQENDTSAGNGEQDETSRRDSAPILRNPTGGPLRVEDPFGKGHFRARRVDGKEVYPHRGIDVQGGIGDSVKAPTSGTVTLGSKKEVIISTSDQEGNVYRTVLAHVDHDLKPGKKGIRVNAGDVVGTVQDPATYITKGNPKDMTPHAHLGLYMDPKGDRKKQEVLDPNDYLATRLYDRDRNHRPVPLNGKIAR